MNDKVYRILVVFLLAVLAIAQGVSVYTTISQSAACSVAIEAASALQDDLRFDIENMPDNYETDVYEKSDNINQQMFRAAEYQFFIQHIVAQQNAAILDVLATCN